MSTVTSKFFQEAMPQHCSDIWYRDGDSTEYGAFDAAFAKLLWLLVNLYRPKKCHADAVECKAQIAEHVEQRVARCRVLFLLLLSTS